MAKTTKTIEFNSLGLEFTMIRTSGNVIGCDAVIEGIVWDGTSGKAGFPSNGLPYKQIKIGDDIEADSGMGPLRHVILHELGHCVGMRHTDFYNRSISCGSGGDEGQGNHGAHHIPGTPTNAVRNGSVMNSCYNDSSNGQWTDNDVTALVYLYGASFCEAFEGLQVGIESAHGGYVRSGIASQGYEVNQQSHIGLHEKYTVECSNGKAGFRNAFGRYLSAGNSNDGWRIKQHSNLDTWELFTPQRQSNGTWTFKTTHNRYMRADNDFNRNLDQQTYGGSWEKFTIAALGDTGDIPSEQLTLREFAEVGLVSIDDEWADVRFSRGFSNPVVIAGPPSYNGEQPVVVRVRNVTSDGFEIKLSEYEYLDGNHSVEQVAWMAVEAGEHTDKQGVVWEARKFIANGDKEARTTRSFNSNFGATPAVFATAQTYNGDDPFAVRVDNLSASSFQVILDEEEAKTDGHGDETIGYLAISEAPNSDHVKTLFFGSAEVTDAWTDVDAISLMMQEETSADPEVGHAADTVNVFGVTHDAGGTPMYFAQDVSYDGTDTAALRWQ